MKLFAITSTRNNLERYGHDISTNAIEGLNNQLKKMGTGGMAKVSQILHKRREKLTKEYQAITTGAKVMTIRKPAVRTRKGIILNQLDYFASLSKNEQKVGLLSFMQTIGLEEPCPEPNDYVMPELDEEFDDPETSMFEESDNDESIFDAY